jgi:hypothetical protein
LVFACSGCIRSVADRGTGWWRVTSDHVRLSTDVDHDRAITAGWAFEDLYRALEQVFPRCDAPPITERVDVTMFAHGDEYDRVSPAHTSGFFRAAQPGILGTEPTLVIRATHRVYGAASGYTEVSGGGYTQIYAHELTHRFVARCYPDAPPWLHEGMAKYFETLRVGGSDVIVGVAPYRVAASGRASSTFHAGGIDITGIGRDHLRAPSELFALAPGEFYADARRSDDYAGAWALVHFLMLGPDHSIRDRFTQYLAAMPQAGGDVRRPSSPLAGLVLDDAVTRYFDAPLNESRVAYAAPSLPDPTIAALDPDEMHLALAHFAAQVGDADIRDETRQHLVLASGDSTTQTRAALLDLEMGFVPDGTSKAAYIAALAAEHPDDLDVLSARAAFEISRRAPTNEARMLLDRLVARTDLRAIDLARAAALTRVLREPILGLDLARRAVATSPSNAYAHMTYAALLTENDYPREAAREIQLGFITLGHAAPPADQAVEIGGVTEEADAARMTSDVLPAATELDASPGRVLALFEGEARATRRATTLDPRCIGFVGAPVGVVAVPADAGPLLVHTLNAIDTVLVLEDAAHRFYCDDDSAGAQRSAVLATFPPGPLVIRVGTFRRLTARVAPPGEPDPEFDWAGGDSYSVAVDRPHGTLDPSLAASSCGLRAPEFKTLDLGTPVVLGRHRAVSPPDGTMPDVVRDEGWVPAMDEFVGRHAVVTALWSVDAAGCSVVAVDVDGGHWLWRVRDLAAP